MPGKKITVLHVDDDETYLEIVKLYLEKRNSRLHVDTVSSAKQALLLLRSRDYDVIISDQQMPVMTGLELLKRLRKQGCNIPFAILTGMDDQEFIDKSRELGADLLLNKHPVTDSLFNDLHGFISGTTGSKQEKSRKSI